MLNTPCSKGLSAATVANVREVFGERVDKDIASFMRLLFESDPGTAAYVSRVDAFSIALEGILKKIMSEKKTDDMIVWTSSNGRVVTAAKGSQAYNRSAYLKNINSQYPMASAQARIAGQVRKWGEKQRELQGGGQVALKGAEDFDDFTDLEDLLDVDLASLPDVPFTRELFAELAKRLEFSDDAARLFGAPPVTINPALQADPHAAYISFGDVASIFQNLDTPEELINAAFRSSNPEVNIPFQQIADAAREIIERSEGDLVLETAEQVAEFQQSIKKILSEYKAYSADDAIRATQKRNEKWMQSPEGQAAADILARAMVGPEFRSALIERATRNTILSLTFAKADGYQMAKSLFDSVQNTEWTGESLQGLGAIFFGAGLRKVFADDPAVLAMLDEAPLAFAEQLAAKIGLLLHPNDMAVLKETTRMLKATRAEKARKGGGKGKGKPKKKTEREEVNTARQENGDELAEKAAQLADEQVETNQNIRSGEASIEGAKAAQTFYNELRYGSMVGGLAKILSKVSDRAYMGVQGKTMMIGAEHISLENAARVSEVLAKFRDAIGNDMEMISRVFEAIKKAGNTEAAMKAELAGLPAAEKAAGEELVKIIDDFFGMGNINSLMRNGIFAGELGKNLKYVGLGHLADDFTDTTSISDTVDYWRKIVPAEGSDLLSTLGKFYTAQQLSMIPASIADSAVRHFGHKAEGLTYAEAMAQGWRPLDVDNGTLGRFMKTGAQPVLFPNEVATRLELMERHLDFDRQIKNEKFRKIIGEIDAITSIMKSSLTVWRPGHHMVSSIGNAFMNVLAGVTNPNDYIYGVKLLIRNGDIGDVDVRALDEMMAQNAPAGYKLKEGATETVKININGKMEDVSLDNLVYGMNVIGGVPISPRRIRDTPAEELESSSRFFENLAKKPGAKQIAQIDHQLGRVAAVRDNFFRLAMFVKELRTGGPYKTLDDAYLAAAQKVHEFHPTVGTLTAWERKNARRAFYFYTWQKQAFFKILEVAANRPALITIPSKLQFAIATSQGLEPDSFGDPFAASRLWAGYNENSLYGPQWEDDIWGAMGVKPASPQMDVIDAYLSSITFKPEDGLWENIGNMGGQALNSFLTRNAAPAIVMGAEIISGKEVGEFGQPLAAKNMGEYLIDKTGLGVLSSVFGVTPWGPRSDVDLTPYGKENRERLWSNWWTGMKWTYYESPPALQRARQEEIDYWQKTLQSGKFAPKLSPYDIGEGIGQ